MLYKGEKGFLGMYLGEKVFSAVYLGAKLIWSAISSCFGMGYWKGDEPWDGADTWNSTKD